MSTERNTPSAEPSEAALTGIVFAAMLMFLVGFFQMLAGLVAIVDDDFYVVARNYTFELDVSAWGWIHLLLGALVLGTSLGLFGRRKWAVVTGLVLVTISAISNFFFIPYYPIWSLLLIALAVWVMWALTRPGVSLPR